MCCPLKALTAGLESFVRRVDFQTCSVASLSKLLTFTCDMRGSFSSIAWHCLHTCDILLWHTFKEFKAATKVFPSGIISPLKGFPHRPRPAMQERKRCKTVPTRTNFCEAELGGNILGHGRTWWLCNVEPFCMCLLGSDLKRADNFVTLHGIPRL